MDDVEMEESEQDGADARTGYRRSAGSRRGEARRRQLLDRVTDDLAANGLVDFSLRRAARAARTTHKVLLYHFDGVEDLLQQAVVQLRARRTGRTLVAATAGSADRPLADRVRAIWPILVGAEARVLDQAIGLAMYDPEHYAALAKEASKQYLPTLLSLCPEHWTGQRKFEIAELILGVLRGFLIEWRTSGDADGIDAGDYRLAGDGAAGSAFPLRQRQVLPHRAVAGRCADDVRSLTDPLTAKPGTWSAPADPATRQPPNLRDVVAAHVASNSARPRASRRKRCVASRFAQATELSDCGGFCKVHRPIDARRSGSW